MVLTFPAGMTTVTFDVATQEDSINENTESFGGVLSNPTGGGAILGPDFRAVIEITDNDCKFLQAINKLIPTDDKVSFSAILNHCTLSSQCL